MRGTDKLPVGPLARLTRSRHEPAAFLPRRLGEQLLGPEAEPARVRVDDHLVLALAPAAPQLETELEAGIVLVPLAALGRLDRPVEQRVEIDP